MAYSKIIYGGNVLIDLTGDTVAADKLLAGITAHGKDGEEITGTCAYDAATGDATAADLTLYAKATQAAPTGTGVYIKRAGAQIQAAAVWWKANGLWAKSDKTAIEAGKNYRMG